MRDTPGRGPTSRESLPANSAVALTARAAGPPITAPDGITVRPIDISPCAHLALAEGDIEPGHTYGIHTHLTIEQVTYVLSGRIRAITQDPERGQTSEIVAATGDSVVTLPGQSLQFAAADDAPARVLFITSPPYPADHSDTVTLDTHRPLNQDERARLPERRNTVLGEFRQGIGRPLLGTEPK